jgi:uncharacterized protein YkwD
LIDAVGVVVEAMSMIKRLAITAASALLFLAAPATPAWAACQPSGLLGSVCSEPSQPSQPQPAPSQSPSSQPSSPAPAPAAAPAPAPAGGSIAQVPAGAARLLELINGDRVGAGLPAMAARGEVASIAAGHSEAMARRGEIWHNSAYFTSAVRQRLGARSLAENVAMNSTVDGAHRALMNSPGHRANILNARLTVVGLAVVRDARGVVFVTQNFVEPGAAPVAAAPKATSAPAPAGVRAATATSASEAVPAGATQEAGDASVGLRPAASGDSAGLPLVALALPVLVAAVAGGLVLRRRLVPTLAAPAGLVLQYSR